MYGSNLFKRELNQTASRIAVAVTMSVATPLALPTVAWSQTVTESQTCVTAVVPSSTVKHPDNGDPGWIGTSANAQVPAGSNTYSLTCGGNAAALGNESVAIGFGAGVVPNNGSYDLNDATNPATASSATRATAIGVKSYVHENNGSAFGYMATTSGDGGVAIGAGALAGDSTNLNNKLGAGAIAIGTDSQAKYSGAIAIGKEAKVGTGAGSAGTDTGGIAIGEAAESWKKDAIAIGSNSSAQHENSIAIGAGVVTTADNQISIGKTGQTYRLGGLATPNDGKTYVVKVDQDGDLSTVEMAAGASEPGLKLSGATANSPASAASVGAFTNAVALGSGATVTGNGGIAIGAGVTAGAGETVIGGSKYKLSGLQGGTGAASGSSFFVTVDSSGNLGWSTVSGGGDPLGWKATGTGGGAASASTITAGKADALALGSGASATETNAVALGAKSTAGAANGGMNFAIAGQTLTNQQAANGVVSVSGGGINRQITGVADGAVTATSTDAINGSQLFKVSDALDDKMGEMGTTLGSGILGTTVTVAPNGTLTTSKFSLGSAQYNTVQDTFTAIKSSIDSLGSTGNIGVSLRAADGTTNLTAATTSGNFASAVGSAAEATGNNTLALGGAAKATAAGATAVGQGSQATGTNGTAIGQGAQAAANGTAIGQGAQAAAGGIAIGQGVTAGAGQTVIGGSTYQLSGLKGGTGSASTSTYVVTVDANGNLGWSTVGGGTGGDPLGWKATGTGGGAASASTITAGKADALALGSGASATETNAVALGAKSTAGAANSGMNFAIAGQNLTNNQAANGVVSVSGGGINRQITGVADGAVTSTSTDAINGSQLFKVADALDDKMTNIGATLGSGILGTTVSMTADGTLTTSQFKVGSANYKTVQDAFDGINTSITNISNGGSVGVSLRGADGSTSLAPATTSGKFASAIGSGATATGDNTLALGGGSKATADNATAVGATAEATHAGSAAIGAGAKSERENQMVYGTASSTHTMKGTTSAASQAQVSKSDNYIMVTNTNGDVAAYRASDLNLASQSDLTNIRNEVNNVRHDVNRAFKQIDENTQGIAIAIAMTGALTLPVNHNFGISANWGNYEGKNAFSSTAAFRLSEHLIASGALGVGLDTGSVGTRVGVQMTW
jgi:hypothetical protein